MDVLNVIQKRLNFKFKKIGIAKQKKRIAEWMLTLQEKLYLKILTNCVFTCKNNGNFFKQFFLQILRNNQNFKFKLFMHLITL